MKQAYFITGTDTEVGKTFITAALLWKARNAGRTAIGLKPIAAGTNEFGRNDDIETLRNANSIEVPPQVLNTYCFDNPIAPHIAACEAGVALDFAPILAARDDALTLSESLLIEGVGGFRVPLGVDRDSADLAVALDLPVILVIGLRLGCLNHALLTVEAIQSRGLPLAGWIGNNTGPAMARQGDNVATLARYIPAPCLGFVPRLPMNDPRQAAGLVEWPPQTPA